MGWRPVDGDPFAEDELNFEDLVKKREEPKPQPVPFAASSVTEQDYSPFAAFGQTVESPASIFQKPTPKRPEGMAALADPQQYKEVAKGVPSGAVSFVGTTLQGAGAVPATAQANVQKNAQMRIGVLDRLDRGEDLRPKGFGGLATGVADPESDAISFYKSFSPEQRATERQKLQGQLSSYRPTPLAEQPLYKAGESVQAFGKTILPAAPGYEDAFGRQIGEGLGSLIAGLPFGAAGRIPGTIFFGAGGMGEAGTRAIAYDQAEKRAGRPGLTQDQINTAALYGVGPGTTDMLPVEALLGRLHVPVPGRKALAQAIGRIGGQAFIEGMQEGGQQFLQNLIAKGVYKPDQALSQEVRENAEVGGAVGAAAEAAKEAGGSIWQRLLGRRGHAAGTRPDAGAGVSDPFAQPLTPAPGGEGVSLAPAQPIDVTFEDLIPPERRLNPPTEGPVPQAGLEPPPPSPAPAAPQVLPAQAVEAAPVRSAQMQEQFGTTQDALQLGRASQAEAAPGEPESLPMPSGSFSTQDVMMALGAPSAPEVDRDALGYYSKALESAKALKQAKGTSDQMLSQLETAGVKNAEIESTGLDKFLLGPELAQQRRGLLAQSNAIAQLKTELGDKKNPPTPERAAQIQSELATAQPALVAATVQYAQAARTGARPITKQEITDFLEQNRVGLKETRYGDIDPEVLALRDRRDALGKMLSPGGDRQGMSYEDISDEHERVSNEFDRAIRGYREPKWSEYSLDPANPTYRESLLSIPEASQAREAHDAEEQRLNRKYWDSHRQHWTVAATPEERAEMTRLEGEMLKENERNVKNAYQSGHWRDTPNVVAHIRTGEYQDTQGRKVLNLDELQSDWGQTVREGGALDQEKIQRLKSQLRTVEQQWFEANEASQLNERAKQFVLTNLSGAASSREPSYYWEIVQHTALTDRERALIGRMPGTGDTELSPEVKLQAKMLREERKELNARFLPETNRLKAEISQAERAAPSHPLVNTTDQWVTTAMRRLIQQAVDAGVDGISLTPGKVQAERFNLGNVLSEIHVRANGAYERTAEFKDKKGYFFGSALLTRDGKISTGDGQLSGMSGTPLSDVVGRELADKVMQADVGRGPVTMTGQDFEIGGEGMKATYDGIYPRILGKLLQKLDPSIKAEKTKLLPSGDRSMARAMGGVYDNGNEAFANDFIFFPLTEKAKQKTRDEGQPMFALGAGQGDITKTAAFKRWFGDSKVVGYGGEPKMVYHATLSDFDAFSRRKASPESDMGAGFYFTDTPEDAANNYAHEGGPDIDNRIQRAVEQLENDDDFRAEIEEANEGKDPDDPDYIDFDDRAREVARQSLGMAHEGVTLPVYLKIENPVVVGPAVKVGGPQEETFFDYEDGYDPETDEYGEPKGSLIDFIEAFRSRAWDNSDAADDIIASIVEVATNEGGLSASKLIDGIKRHEQSIDFYDDEGNLAINEIIRSSLERLGYDGIIDNTVSSKWGQENRYGGGMKGVYPDTTHYIAFRPNQIKSAIGNRGSFDPNDDRLTYALQGFYSPAIRATEKLKQDKATPEQWWSMISKTPGVRQEELQWMGLKEWLDEQKTPVYARNLTESDGSPQVLREARKIIPKAEVLDFMTQHQMELEDRLLGSAGTGGTGVTQEQIEERARELEEEIRDEMHQEAESEWYQANDPSRYEIEINEDSALDREDQKIYDQALVNYQGAKRFFDDYLRQQYPIPEIGHAIAAPKFSEFLPDGWNPDYGNPQYFYDLDHPGDADNIRNQGPYETEDEAREAAEEHKARLIEEFENGDSQGYETPDHVYHEAWGQAMRRARDELGDPDEDGEGGGTLFRQYAIKGGTEYSEALVRFPALRGRYRSAHYSDQELVHIRFDIREGPKGDRVLFIHEIQSDLHQRSRGFGFGPEGYAAAEEARQRFGHTDETAAQMDRLDNAINASLENLAQLRVQVPGGLGWRVMEGRQDEYNALANRERELQGEKTALQGKVDQRKAAADRYIITFKTQGAPEAPYTGNAWWELGFKRMVQYAVENNFDAIALTTPGQIHEASYTPVAVAEKFYGENLPRFIEKYLKKWGVTPSKEVLSGTRSGQNPYYRITDAMREDVQSGGQPLALGPASPKSDVKARLNIGGMVKAGRTVTVPYADAVLDVAKPYLPMLPQGIPVAALNKVAPVPGRKGWVIASFKTHAGQTLELEGPYQDLATRRAWFGGDGLGGRAVFLPRFNAVGSGDPLVIGEMRHEAIHALRQAASLPGEVWGRLLDHAKQLRLLDSDFKTYLQRIGSPNAKDAPDGVTILSLYEDAYNNHRNYQESIDQEYVAHLAELYSHGELLPQEVAPVKDLLDDIFAGKYAKSPAKQTEVTEAAAFAGPWAKTAKQNPLIQAQKLAENGADPQTIWKRTGWFQGADDRWRFEIDDSLASIKLDDKIISGGVGNFRTTLGAFLDHPALFKAYPFLRGLPVYLTTHMSPGEAGHKGVSDGESREGMPPAWITVGVKGYEPQDRQRVLSALLHEVQHDIQDIENFAAGGNMQGYASGFMNRLFDGQLTDFDQRLIRADRVRSDYREWMTFAKNAALKPDDQDLRDGLTYFSSRLSQSVAFEAYQRLAGEVESREVENRRHLTPAERRETFPAPVSKDEQRVKMSWADARYSDDMLALAGPRAAGAPRGAFATAERREAQGRTPDQIWQELQVTRGPETKWRWEIDDSAAKIIGLDKVFEKPSPGIMQRLMGKTAKTGNVKTAINVPLLNVLHHPKLYTAYPFLRQMRVDLAYGPDAPTEGQMRSRNTESGSKVYKPIKASAPDAETLKSVLLHEIQHYIQQREGFATGSDIPKRPDYQRSRVSDDSQATALYDPARDTRGDDIRYWGARNIVTPTIPERHAIDIMNTFGELDAAKARNASQSEISELEDRLRGHGMLLEDAMLVRPEDYTRSAGEAEAREVEARIGMTPAERRATRPLADLPRDAIVGQNTQTRDYAKAYDAVMEQAKIWKQIQDQWKTAEPIGAGVSVVRPVENLLAYGKEPGNPLMIFDLYPELGSAVPEKYLSDALAALPYTEQRKAVDAIMKDLRSRNMQPTLDKNASDDAFAFWARYDPRMVAFDPRLYAKEVEELAKAQYGDDATVSYDAFYNVYKVTSPEMKLAAQKAEIDADKVDKQANKFVEQMHKKYGDTYYDKMTPEENARMSEFRVKFEALMQAAEQDWVEFDDSAIFEGRTAHWRKQEIPDGVDPGIYKDLIIDEQLDRWGKLPRPGDDVDFSDLLPA
jgi:hypothetical protein